jgi:gas vesicle protein
MLKMSANPKNKTLGTIALAALVGGATGAFISLMLAPKSGKELRQDIQNQAENLIGQVENSTFQRAEAIKQRSADLVDKGKQLKADIQIFIQDLKLKKSDYIDITQSASVETSPQPSKEPKSPQFAPTEIPPHDETPTV